MGCDNNDMDSRGSGGEIHTPDDTSVEIKNAVRQMAYNAGANLRKMMLDSGMSVKEMEDTIRKAMSGIVVCGVPLNAVACVLCKGRGYFKPSSEETVRDDPYFIEVDHNGCSCCGAERTWIVVGPDGRGSSTSFESEDDASDLAENLNIAFHLGRESARTT